ncbi:bifunctional O-succinylbenzoate synthase / acetyltransferase [Mycobacterium liflandii 128FXT]|uniref:o-succinylbenzoate synthase n=2 Tax=Mycobacteriaceae TaxID=1762 RepID=L7V479_MYCL1|nr:bifunctional O-succinylbenzoate synthase / acetyltransferase [Mycobacterium liflandii 128FXT]
MIPGPATLPDLLDRLQVVALPMRVRFRGITTREVALIEGPSGWGEFGAFLEYQPPEAAAWLASAIDAAYGQPPPVRRGRIPINATVPAVPPAQVPELLARFPGARTAKVKVAEPGQTLASDVERVNAVRALVPTVRVDANGGWSVDQAAQAAVALTADGPLEYLEQPCATVGELAELRRRIEVPIAADEAIRKAEDPLAVVRAGAADVAVLKVAPLGGVWALLDIAAQIDIPVVISSALDSAVGIAAGLSAAAALPQLQHACGLGTGGLFVEDVAEPPSRSTARWPRSGWRRTRPGCGRWAPRRIGGSGGSTGSRPATRCCTVDRVINLAYDDKGTGEPVLFIAGRGGAGRTWQPHQVPAFLAAGYRCITFDNRGIGATENAEGFTTQTMVNDTAALIESLGIGPVRIVAVSMGSFIAQELMVVRPELVNSAVLMATRGRLDRARKFFHDAEAELYDSGARMPSTYDVKDRLLENFSRKTLNDDAAVGDWLAMFSMWPIKQTPGLRCQLDAAPLTNRLPAYRNIAAPVLVIGFSDDIVTPPYLGREVADSLPNGRYLQIPDAGHLGFFERPEAVNTAALKFFAGTRG